MLCDNERFLADHCLLRRVALIPANLSAANAYEHCEMIRARVSAPAGWRGNAPLVWSLDQVREQSLVDGKLLLDEAQS